MRIYLVGGAVRNRLLQLPVTEKDWLVIGAEPQELISLGYKPVGRDFPVFLHPSTGEEYALARLERKVSTGHKGFVCRTSKDISINEDLARRDLTINAIAQDNRGNLIDPYGGMADLKHRVLRHVSPSFTEDPLRILRTARFLASFAYLGFTLAPSTLALITSMSNKNSADIASLSKERVWVETYKALLSNNPEKYFNLLYECGALQILMPELVKLFCSTHSPAKNLFIYINQHTLEPTLRYATLTMLLSVSELTSFSKRLHVPNNYTSLASALQLIYSKYNKSPLSAANVWSLLADIDALRNENKFKSLIYIMNILKDKFTILSTKNSSSLLEKSLAAVKQSDKSWIQKKCYVGKQINKMLEQQYITLINQVMRLFED